MITSLVDRIRRNPDDGTAWQRLTSALVAAKDARGLSQVLAQRHQAKGDAGSFAFLTGLEILRVDGSGAISWLASQADENDAFRGIWLILFGLDRANGFDIDAGSRLLRQGAHAASIALPQAFQSDVLFRKQINQMLSQANLLEPSSYEPPPGLPAVPMDFATAPASRGKALLVACCDETYLLTYGQHLAEALETELPGWSVLIHVINPTDRTIPLRQALRQRFTTVFFSTEHDAPAQPTYYASARLLIAGEVMRRFATGVILLDVDTAVRPGFLSLVEEAARHDIGYLSTTDRILPSLLVDAALLGLRPGAAATRFLDLATRFLRAKLADPVPLWMVDQAALLWALAQCRAEGRPMADLSAMFRGTLELPEFLKADHDIPLEERIGARGDGRRTVSFDAELRPVFSER